MHSSNQVVYTELG